MIVQKKIFSWIATLGKDEIEDIIEKDKQAEVICHYCNTQYFQWRWAKHIERNKEMKTLESAKNFKIPSPSGYIKDVIFENILKKILTIILPIGI